MGNKSSYCPFDNPYFLESIEVKNKKVKICELHRNVKFCEHGQCRSIIRDQGIFCLDHRCQYDGCQSLKYKKLPPESDRPEFEF